MAAQIPPGVFSTRVPRPFDVTTELWFEDESMFRGTVRYHSCGVLPDEVIEDEKRLFDRSKTRMATAIECESSLQK
jgi:hypothetical protein